jgi:hypothetical protein
MPETKGMPSKVPDPKEFISWRGSFMFLNYTFKETASM